MAMSDAVPKIRPSSSSSSSSSPSQFQRRVFLRLFLIRHGETESNVQKIVIGQSDSPLTAKGIEQTKLLGKRLGDETYIMDIRSFWRIYSSDLQRAQHTTELLLKELQIIIQKKQSPSTVRGGEEEEVKPRLDTRLRELGRGAREGLPKAFSEMEAVLERQRLGILQPMIPLFETPQDGWNRISDWLEEVMEDAIQECLAEDNHDATNNNDRALNVLVISHSGLLRLFLEQLLGLQRLQQHPDARFEDKNGVSVFSIPNSSLTILKMDILSKQRGELDAVQIEQLANTEHYSRMQAGAPPRSQTTRN